MFVMKIFNFQINSWENPFLYYHLSTRVLLCFSSHFLFYTITTFICMKVQVAYIFTRHTFSFSTLQNSPHTLIKSENFIHIPAFGFLFYFSVLTVFLFCFHCTKHTEKITSRALLWDILSLLNLIFLVSIKICSAPHVLFDCAVIWKLFKLNFTFCAMD